MRSIDFRDKPRDGADSSGQTPTRSHASPCLYTIDAMRIEEVNLVTRTQYGMFPRALFKQGVRFEENGPFTGAGWGFEDNDLAFQMELKDFQKSAFLRSGVFARSRTVNGGNHAAVRASILLHYVPEENNTCSTNGSLCNVFTMGH